MSAQSQDGRFRATEFTRDNAAEVIRGYSGLIFHWLKCKNILHERAEILFCEFWSFLWERRDSFDAKRGSFTTWLKWKFKDFIGNKAKVFNNSKWDQLVNMYDSVANEDGDELTIIDGITTEDLDRAGFPHIVIPVPNSEIDPIYWDEWFKTYIDTLPIASNNYEHAALMRQSLQALRIEEARLKTRLAARAHAIAMRPEIKAIRHEKYLQRKAAGKINVSLRQRLAKSEESIALHDL